MRSSKSWSLAPLPESLPGLVALVAVIRDVPNGSNGGGPSRVVSQSSPLYVWLYAWVPYKGLPHYTNAAGATGKW